MRARMLLVLVAGLLVGADDPKGGAATKDVLKAIGELNDAFRFRNADAIPRLMTEDHVAITPWGGVQDRDDQVKTLTDLKIAEYRAGKPKVTWVSKEVALITYPLTLKGTYKGKDLARKNHVAAVWVNRDGKWLEASYQETPVGGE